MKDDMKDDGIDASQEKVDLGGLIVEPDLWLLNEARLRS